MKVFELLVIDFLGRLHYIKIEAMDEVAAYEKMLGNQADLVKELAPKMIRVRFYCYAAPF